MSIKKQSNLNDVNNSTTQVVLLNELFSLISQARLTILIVTLLVVTSGVSFAIYSAKYKSQGFFQFGGPIPMTFEKIKDKEKGTEKDKDEEHGPGIALSDFKRYAAAYSTNERFNEYVKEKNLASVAGIDSLQQAFTSRDGISQLIEPVYPFTKLDAKELMEQPKGSSNNVIGLKIQYDGNSPETAQKMVDLLGHYAMDSIIYLIYSDALRYKKEEIKTKLTELDSIIIRNKIKMNEYRRREADLRKIIARNPIANQIERQVVEIKEDTAHYLPPTTLLTTTEVQASEANEAIFKAKHEQLQNQILLEYFDRVQSILDSTKSGETVLRSLEPAKESVFKNKDIQDDAVKEVFNAITIENQKSMNVYLNKSRFIAGPTLPVHTTVRLGVVLLISLIIGILSPVLFIIARNWQPDNR